MKIVDIVAAVRSRGVRVRARVRGDHGVEPVYLHRGRHRRGLRGGFGQSDSTTLARATGDLTLRLARAVRHVRISAGQDWIGLLWWGAGVRCQRMGGGVSRSNS